MTTLVAQIAPQRSTQYSALAETLAAPELRLSPLGADVTNLSMVTMGGQRYLKFDLPVAPAASQRVELGMFAMTSAYFAHYDGVGELAGPLLRPLDLPAAFTLPPDLVTTRRYRGKTNEIFTHFLCNVARFSSEYATQPWSALRVLDPLAGGGTTLFVALTLGADVAGIEQNRDDVKSTVAFLQQYTREARIPCSLKEERLKKLGLRWRFTLGKPPQTCTLANGDAVQAAALLPGYRPHLIVTDLPYGIQHQGALEALLSAALPVWAAMLQPHGALAFAWDATRFPRQQMVALVESVSPLIVCNAPPYTDLAHRVDRVIKARDVLVARR